MKKSFIAAAAVLSMATTSLVASEVIAAVGDVKITEVEANKFLKDFSQGELYKNLPDQKKKQLINAMINQELAVAIAKEKKIEETKVYQEMLEGAKRQLLIGAWQKSVTKKLEPSEAELKEIYKKDKDEYKIPETRHARHILVKEGKKAKDIISKLTKLKGKALKEKFIELAKKESTGPSGKNGGDLSFFPKKAMVKEFSDATWKLKTGEITKTPVKTRFGYHVIYLEEIKPEIYKSFKDVKDAIRQKVLREKVDKAIETALEKKKESLKVVNTLDKKPVVDKKAKVEAKKAANAK